MRNRKDRAEVFVIWEFVIGRSLGISCQYLQLYGSILIQPKCLRPLREGKIADKLPIVEFSTHHHQLYKNTQFVVALGSTMDPHNLLQAILEALGCRLVLVPS